MSPEEIRSLRKDLSLTQRQLADALKIDADTVRAWEKEESFPTKAHCEAMEKLRVNPPPKTPKSSATPMQVLADPKFFALLRKLVAHPKLRAEVERISADYPDPATSGDP
ncbi:MAG: helix-turn-helix transcriptional regulator [Polyangiales bacterium]